jgi:glycosyltransferase involved in cell wall biosynthesis
MITDILGAGGKERRLTQLICALASEYHYHCGLVVLSDDIHFREIEYSGIEVFKLVRKTKKDLGIFWSLYRIMMDFKPDVVQSWEPMVSFYALPVAKLQSIKFISAAIANARSPRRFSQVWILYKLTNFFSDAVVANSRAGLRSYRPPQKRSYCIHNGFDFKRTLKIKDPYEISGYLGVETRNVVGMVAAFTDKKDYPTFIGAALALLDKRHELSFDCVGDGPKLEQIKQMVPDHYRDLIIFTGVQKDVESIINIFDVGVLATYTEGISNAIME